VTVETLDNPGWRLRVDLVDTALAGQEFTRREKHRSNDDWLACRVDESRFHAPCGPANLPESLEIFLRWAR
jgi:hypothetical protein